MSKQDERLAKTGNMGVDWVIVYRYDDDLAKNGAPEQFERLVQRLASVGLATEVRQGHNSTLLVFVKEGAEDYLHGEVFRSRVKDWIYNIRTEAPAKETKRALAKEPLYSAERLRIVHQLITNSDEDGGAGIVPKSEDWKNVESIFALHDHEFNKRWIKQLSGSYSLTIEQLDEIRNNFGEKVAFYFAFIQVYSRFLVYIAGIGATAWFIFGSFSYLYALINGLGCVVFTEYWRHQEVDLAIRWGVRGVSKIDSQRRQFKHTSELVDSVTGQKVKYFSPVSRLGRQLLQVPFGIAVLLLQGCLIATCFAIEVFISEVYAGPLKQFLVFLPTGILTTCMPILTLILQRIAKNLTEYENYETHGAYSTALTQKLFIMDLVTSYLAIFLTAFIYIPFGSIIVPYLDIFSVTVQPFVEHQKQMEIPEKFTINPNRLKTQVIYFTVTAQIVNFLLELIVPYVQRHGTAKVKQLKRDYAIKHGGTTSLASDNDAEEEAEFLKRVRQEADLPEYDALADIREMVIQFGYLSLFSVVWPLTGVSFLVNSWIETRADAVKICIERRRPKPWRADTIGPWLDALSFLTWLGSLTTSALLFLFQANADKMDGTPYGITAWAFVLSIFLSEQAFLVIRWAVRTALTKFDSSGRQQERQQRFLVRKHYIDENVKELSEKPTIPDDIEGLDRASLEEEARRNSLHQATAIDRFWGRQRGWRESAQIGSRLIERSVMTSDQSKKEL